MCADPVLQVGGILLVRPRGHRQKHPGHLRQKRHPQVRPADDRQQADEGLPGRQEEGVPQEPHAVPPHPHDGDNERQQRGQVTLRSLNIIQKSCWSVVGIYLLITIVTN